MNEAFFHRSSETLDEDQAAKIHFTLRVFLDTLWLVLLLVIGNLFFSGLRRFVLEIITIFGYLNKFTATPTAVLVRKVQHQRLAIIDFVTSLVVAGVSISIAFYSASIWALLVSTIISFICSVVMLYLWKPVWHPAFAWKVSSIKYFFQFGMRTMIGNVVNVALEEIDDLWTNLYLGDLKLGLYSRAYKFATYPRTILAWPVNKVIMGTYAELKFNRLDLSKAFFRTNAFLIRTGFFLAGWLTITAPELIRILIGERWLLMLSAFRLMLVFALLDPIKASVSDLLIAVGKPEKISQARIFQLAILISGLFVLGNKYDILGVALAVDIMLLSGMVILMVMVSKFVDISFFRLFFIPTVALALGITLNYIATQVIIHPSNDWISLLERSVSFGLGYISVLYIFESKFIFTIIREVIDQPDIK